MGAALGISIRRNQSMKLAGCQREDQFKTFFKDEKKLKVI